MGKLSLAREEVRISSCQFEDETNNDTVQEERIESEKESNRPLCNQSHPVVV